ncbi:uncharacterized protein RJT20DRAFT_28818 [Scheffersomyces xylosifermentans]|uniref:uncharacterized protein n=1 Tax=Scheffersomyces xylosifermentans TaxID=1304137 RepID=UPI00315C86AE
MSINNVILKPNYSSLLGKSELPFEISKDGLEVLKYYTPTPRQTLSITSHNSKDSKIHIKASDGYIYVTTKRLVYITASQGDINTFSVDVNLAPVLQFSHEIKLKWVGANYWEFIFFSPGSLEIASDGFPKDQYFKGQIQFNDGGIFTFLEHFNNVLNDAVNNSHIDEQLPQYSET